MSKKKGNLLKETDKYREQTRKAKDRVVHVHFRAEYVIISKV